MIRKMLWKLGVIGPTPKFKIGDSVQIPGSDHLMVIQKIDFSVKARSIVYTCKWFHQGLKNSQINLYEEHQLKLYDWYSFFLMGNEKWHGDMVADHES
jgi:uncharacterized protein YodC (DUF2158 family)